MAKALLGHIGTADPAVLAEVRRLRSQVDELRAQVLRLQADNDRLTAALADAAQGGLGIDDLTGDAARREPALI